MLAVSSTLVGVVLIGLAARDVFDTLFDHGGRGSLSRLVAAATWRTLHRSGPWGRGAVAFAGPVAVVFVVAVWATLVVVGFAFVYLPHVPDGFAVLPEVAGDGALLLALYFSAVSLTTLGYGEMTPTADGLQLVAPLEALVGLGLLTASVAWFLSIYPVLARRRALAYDLELMARAERDASIDETEGLVDALDDLHARVIEVERDLAAFPITFFFAELDSRYSLAVGLPALVVWLGRLDDAALAPRDRLHAAMLREAIDDFAATVGSFAGYEGRDADEVLRLYAERHAPRARR